MQRKAAQSEWAHIDSLMRIFAKTWPPGPGRDRIFQFLELEPVTREFTILRLGINRSDYSVQEYAIRIAVAIAEDRLENSP